MGEVEKAVSNLKRVAKEFSPIQAPLTNFAVASYCEGVGGTKDEQEKNEFPTLDVTVSHEKKVFRAGQIWGGKGSGMGCYEDCCGVIIMEAHLHSAHLEHIFLPSSK
jgi:hypothetical protein